MPTLMTSRAVPAPDKDWLTEAEVLTLLGDIGSTTLSRMMREGRFPRPVLWGRDGRWRWEDVAWFHLGKLLSPRLDGADGGEVPDDDTPTPYQPDTNHLPTARQPRTNRRQPDAEG